MPRESITKPPRKPKPKTYVGYVMVPVEQDVKDWLAELAKQEDRPVGQMARVLLKEAREARAASQQNTR